ncbi:GlsB/YeaQ/YmgE family stress response membrane protein [Dictyobacter aurantiacus]|uniref:Transglycosylase n=1 Tax=Dictyobacter aurantiacus TaxID=1936993 RepID=A0A401ZFD0_9CHLR|nr:GlsB/YeaQ/YmgE family stress response membrane protein [Dictyobacter aurantiacus]GCE05503.1 transglycosylase [Dictyobacter aurantiacus]
MNIALHPIHVTEILQPGNLIAWILVGLIAGALAGTVVRGRGYGCIGNIIVGLVGSVIGSILASALDLGTFHFCGSIFISFIGAAIFVAILQFLSGDSRQ